MSRPWQVWSLFALCLLLVVCGLSWLTVKAVELDRRQRLLAVRADFEGDVRLALRRMDLELAEILARETSWPPLAYRSFYLVDTDDLVGTAADVDPFGPPFADGGPSAGSSDPGKSVGKPAPAFPARQRVASPLLVPRSDFVQLYFQLDAANRASSPNCPPPDQQEAARRQGMTPELGEWYRARLSELQQLCDNHSLAELVPPIPAPAAPAATTAVAAAGRDQD
ncbi:MAG: hypothetical protein GTO03_03185, partial [Planctomycetales bacterium]|nr:hypothetical protein [Planctomycetales bacterium]